MRKNVIITKTEKQPRTILEKTQKEIKSRRSTKVPRRIFSKTMTLNLVGCNPNEIREVAAAVHKLSHPLTVGGKDKRKVQITCTHSSETEMIYNGNV